MEKKDRKRRGHSRYYLLFVLAVLGLGALGSGGYYLLSHINAFEYRSTSLSGNSAVPDSLFMQVMNRYKGENLLAISSKKVSRELMNLSRVKSVKIRKHFLHTLSIQVKESTPVLFVKSREGQLYPVDGEGRVLAIYNALLPEDLPIATSYLYDEQFQTGKKLRTTNLERILRLNQRIVKEYPDFLPRISEYYTVDNTVYIVELDTGTRIIPPEEKLADQLRRYLFVQENGNIGSRKVVDLRYDNQVVVKAGTE